MKKNKKIKLLVCAAYFFSYIARQGYAASLTEIIYDLGVSKSLAGMAVTGSFIAYGLFQIVSGIIGDKFKPEKIVFIGLLGSSLVNLLVCIFPNIYIMNVLWCINGIFQSLIWPPIVRILVDELGVKEYSLTVVRLTQASYASTILVYILAPIIIKLLNWRFVFALFGFAALCFSFVWITKTKKIMSEGRGKSISVELDNVEFSDIPKENKTIQTKYNEEITNKENKEIKTKDNKAIQLKEEKKAYKKRLIAMGFIPIFISTFIAGFIRDGISTWLPTYINDVYNLGSFSSILTGAVIPFCCALFLEFLNVIGEKIGNEVKAASLFSGIAAFSCGAMFLLFSKISALDVAFMALITICVHGVNLMFVCNLPKRFSKYGKSSTLSGILNSAVYAGAALSIYGTAFVSTEYGWKAVTLIWTCLISISFILCFSWRKRFIRNV